MDFQTALEGLEQVRKNLSIQSYVTKDFWNDKMRYKLYDNVIDYYSPETVNFVAVFNDTNEDFETWLNELKKMDNEY